MIVEDVPPPPPPVNPQGPLNEHGNGPIKEEWMSQAICCEVCAFWCNGPTQWEDHKLGKKHRRKAKWRWEQAYRDKDVHIKTGIILATKAIQSLRLIRASAAKRQR